jgi:tetratricopeptide (TPR) repeat protein
LELKERIGNVQGKAASLHQLAGIYKSRGDVDKAIALCQQSLDLAERIGNVQGKAITLANLGKLLADEKQDFTIALDYLQQSLEILLRIHSPNAETVKKWIFEVRFNQLLHHSPEAQDLYQQLESADEDTRNQIFSRLRELMNELGNG